SLFLLYVRWHPRFETMLDEKYHSTTDEGKRNFSLMGFWEKLICKTPTTRTYFKFIYRLVSREEVFKLKVYPSIGIGLVLPFIFVYSEFAIRGLEEVVAGSLYLCMYLMQLFTGLIIYMFQFSGTPHSA